MRMGLVAILVAASLAACRRDEYLRERDGEAQIVSISVRTEPRGATVHVNRVDRVWTTPCDIADYTIQRGTQDIEVTLDGYETVSTKVYWDGQKPAQLLMKLRPKEASAAAEPARPAPAATPEPPKRVEEPKPAPVKVEAVAGGTRLKVTSPGAKVRIQAKTVVSETDRPGEIFLPDVPPEKVVVELLEARTDLVIAVVEFSPASGATGKAAGPAPAPVVIEPDRVGEVTVVSKTYGVFVKLEPGLSLQPGEEIAIFRGGKEIARTKIVRITKGDDRYPDGAAQLQKDGPVQKGDEVRRTKP